MRPDCSHAPRDATERGLLEHQSKVEWTEQKWRILRKRGASDLSRWKPDHCKWPAASDSGDLQPAAADRCCPLSKVDWAVVRGKMVRWLPRLRPRSTIHS